VNAPKLTAIIAALGLAVAACAPAPGTGQPTPAGDPCKRATHPAGTYMAQIVSLGIMKAGVREDDVVFGNRNPATNKFEGFDHDVVREVGKALFGVGDDAVDRCIEFTPITSATRIPALQENKVDIVAATMTITGDRLKQIDFSDVYFRTGQRILVKKDNTTIKEVGDLNGKTVCAARGSTSEANVRSRAPQAKLLQLDTYVPCLTALQQNQTDAVSTDEAILVGLVKRDPNTKIVGASFSDEPYGLGIRKDRAGFVDFVNQRIASMMTDGTMKRLWDKHIKPLTQTEFQRPSPSKPTPAP
jgi:putative glutamine transport system substrate-binding protein